MTHYPSRSLLEAALDAAKRGWHVFPLIPWTKRPAVRAWENRATTNPERIARCWAAGPYNIGIATGPSRLVVVDLDNPKDPDDTPPAQWAQTGVDDGADVLAVQCERNGQPYPAETFTVLTGGGGVHLYFTAPSGPELRNTAGTLGWKVDTRAHGGYVVAPCSTVDGHPYTIVNDTPPAPLPAWLAEQLRPVPLPPQRPVMVPLAVDRHGAYLRSAITAELDKVTAAKPGQRNNTLYLAAVALGQLVAGGELDTHQVSTWLAAAAAQNGQSERAAQATIASGLRAGQQRPRKVQAAA